jgi:ABC-type multidrug transport system fused ATPase/permease subunit
VLNLPFLGQEIAEIAWRYPTLRNQTLRLLEPLSAPLDPESRELSLTAVGAQRSDLRGKEKAVGAVFQKVSVRLAGHMVLNEIDLELKPGSHVAVVGPSGAGKSSLLGLLLGWYRPASGQILVDGAGLSTELANQLRAQTAWVDPAIQLWNRTLFDNLLYGAHTGSIPEPELLKTADLHGLLKKLPAGLQTELGENGGLVSGGEGQRVRLGRALHRHGVRLVLLDEPFRGLDRRQRSSLMSRARQYWSHATLLCVTHDVGETLSFPRVLVVDGGRVVEDGSPQELLRQSGSVYSKLLMAEEELRRDFWSNSSWQHLYMKDGQLQPVEKAGA